MFMLPLGKRLSNKRRNGEIGRETPQRRATGRRRQCPPSLGRRSRLLVQLPAAVRKPNLPQVTRERVGTAQKEYAE